eukprot:1161846-Prorocentrum_minimum.AAC.1
MRRQEAKGDPRVGSQGRQPGWVATNGGDAGEGEDAGGGGREGSRPGVQVAVPLTPTCRPRTPPPRWDNERATVAAELGAVDQLRAELAALRQLPHIDPLKSLDAERAELARQRAAGTALDPL